MLSIGTAQWLTRITDIGHCVTVPLSISDERRGTFEIFLLEDLLEFVKLETFEDESDLGEAFISVIFLHSALLSHILNSIAIIYCLKENIQK